MESSAPDVRQRQWYITERWEQYEGEARANLLRIVAIGSFYLIHLLNHYELRLGILQLGEGAGDRGFHISVTALAVAWTMVALGVLLCLRRQIFPDWLKYFSTGSDVVLLTAIAWIGQGPQSPLVVGYFLILGLAALRFSLPLVRFATVASLVGYVCLLGCAKWPQTFWKGDADLRVPRYEQLMVLLAIGLLGIVLGQLLRRVRRAAEEFSERLQGGEVS